MLQPNEFKIYNASAGAGKTYTLVKEFLAILLTSDQPYKFESILAITFTNKAANEMKQRIVGQLVEFSSEDYISNETLQNWANELNLSPEILHERSKNVLTNILHNYSKFSVSTIDKFNLRLMKSFAQDLGVSVNFNVEMDLEALLEDAVNQLFSQIGEDETLTQVLIEIALDNLQEDKSWDITRELINNSKSLYSDSHIEKVAQLQKFDLNEFNEFRKIVYQKVYTLKSSLKKITQEVEDIMKNNQLSVDDFSYGKGGFISFFLKFQNDKFEFPTDRAYAFVENTDPKKYCGGKASAHARATIPDLAPKLKEYFHQANDLVKELTLFSGIQKTITSMSVLNEVEKAVEAIKENQNIVLISEFNKIISATLRKQPSGFIYERIGNKFHHYFIDEFQDTSILQWENLFPLIENARGTSDTVMLVGDPKQSIYRWRGGNPEQMISLIDQKEKLGINVENLPRNWRSYDNIIHFNNDFYTKLAEYLPQELYKELYITGNQQLSNHKKGGYVQLDFIVKSSTAELEEFTHQQIFENIQSIIEQGFDYKDIAILHRKNQQGKLIAEFLSQQNIPLISAESLLLQNSPEIQLIELFLRTISNEDDLISRSQFILKLNELQIIEFEDITQEILQINQQNLTFLKEFLAKQNINIQFVFQPSLSLYDLVEKIIYAFHLGQKNNAYIQYFLDFVLEYSMQNEYNLAKFLSFWEEKKEKLSISLPEGNNAVTLMTIHKSKGLEFPVVILPFADWGDRTENPQFWIPIKNENLPFDEFLMNTFGKLENVSPEIAAIIHKERDEELLDNINMLYVATTRAVEQLYIITTKQEKEVKGIANYFNLIFGQSESNAIIGEKRRVSTPKHEKIQSENIPLTFENWEQKVQISKESSKRWQRKKSIVYGELVHELMKFIQTEKDIQPTLRSAVRKGLIQETETEILQTQMQEIISHPLLKKYFNSEIETISERDFINDLGEIFRPDRLAISNETCTIIDYKTGNESEQHLDQIRNYALNLEKLGWQINQKLIVYIHEKVHVKEVI